MARKERRPNNGKSGIELSIKPGKSLSDLILFLHPSRDSFAGVQNCSVIPAPEGFSDLLEGGLGMAPSQIHRHLPREDNITGASLAGHIRDSNRKMLGHLLLNSIDGDRLSCFFPQNIPKKLFHRFAENPPANQRLICGNPGYCALETSNVGSDMLRNKNQNFFRKFYLKRLSFFSENRQASRIFRRLQFCR